MLSSIYINIYETVRVLMSHVGLCEEGGGVEFLIGGEASDAERGDAPQ